MHEKIQNLGAYMEKLVHCLLQRRLSENQFQP